MKGWRALASGMLVLAAICAVPAISAAQDTGTATAPAVTTTTTPAGPPPSTTTPDATSEGAAAGTPTEPPPSQGRTADSSLGGDRSPADAPSGGATASAATARKSASGSVSMVNFAFSPASITVSVGDTVTWTNQDDAPHNATADDGSFSTPDINKGQSASHRFTQPGSFSYICTIHPNMQGTVRVLASSSGGSGGNAGSSSGSGGSSQSEASAVASPEAAGDSNTLPMTGLAAGALALVGAALVASGLATRVAARLLSIF